LSLERTALCPQKRLRSSVRTRRLTAASIGCWKTDGVARRASIDEKCFIPVARKLVYGITADIASVQVIVDFQVPIQIQLLVDELQQPVETACAHNDLYWPITFMSMQHSGYSAHLSGTIAVILLVGSFTRLFPIAHAPGQYCSLQLG
jgi:hypothetical protein